MSTTPVGGLRDVIRGKVLGAVGDVSAFVAISSDEFVKAERGEWAGVMVAK